MQQRFRFWAVIALIGLGHLSAFAQDGEEKLATPTPGKHQLKASPMQVLQHLIVQQNQQIVEQKEQIEALAKAVEAQNGILTKITEKLEASAAQIEMLQGQSIQVVDHLEDLKKAIPSEGVAAPLSSPAPTSQAGADDLDEPESITSARIATARPVPAGVEGGETGAGVLKVHVVQRGETVSAIADQYGVSSAELLRANRISNPRRLQIGQTLTIP